MVSPQIPAKKQKRGPHRKVEQIRRALPPPTQRDIVTFTQYLTDVEKHGQAKANEMHADFITGKDLQQ